MIGWMPCHPTSCKPCVNHISGGRLGPILYANGICVHSYRSSCPPLWHCIAGPDDCSKNAAWHDDDGPVVCVDDGHDGSVSVVYGVTTVPGNVRMCRGISYTSMFVTNQVDSGRRLYFMDCLHSFYYPVLYATR